MAEYSSVTVVGPHLTYGSWVFQASHGGKGAHNFGDSSKSGARGVRSIEVPDIPSTSGFLGAHLIKPGPGGGARPTPLLKYGSRAVGYTPDGVVLIRIFKVE